MSTPITPEARAELRHWLADFAMACQTNPLTLRNADEVLDNAAASLLDVLAPKVVGVAADAEARAELRRLAQAAAVHHGTGEWTLGRAVGAQVVAVDNELLHHPAGPIMVAMVPFDEPALLQHIAAANPAAMLDLLDALEAAEAKAADLLDLYEETHEKRGQILARAEAAEAERDEALAEAKDWRAFLDTANAAYNSLEKSFWEVSALRSAAEAERDRLRSAMAPLAYPLHTPPEEDEQYFVVLARCPERAHLLMWCSDPDNGVPEPTWCHWDGDSYEPARARVTHFYPHPRP